MRQRFLAVCAFTVIAVVGSAVLAEGITTYDGSTAQGEIMAPTTLTMGGTLRVIKSCVTPPLTFPTLDGQLLQIAPPSQSSVIPSEGITAGTLRISDAFCSLVFSRRQSSSGTVLVLTNNGGSALTISGQFNVGTSSGSFKIIDGILVESSPSFEYVQNYAATSEAEGFAVSTLSTGESISTPEPSSLLLLGTASIAFLWWRRRQKRLG